ncbi:aspartyl-tRNA synthetase [Lacticaseibacillus rhamnosus MTCC 5462]|nr:aspartyl-tRNA synthetase [Lacticaseibacillus rhamnosus MTCC 5462]
MSKRTCYAGDVNTDYLDQEVTLKGWVQKRRSLGSLIFIDLRDREGIVQLVFSDAIDRDALTVANSVRSEYVVEVQGVVKKRKPQAVNPEMKTGDIEVEVHDITILNKAKTPPFYIEDNVAVTEETKLRYRYLDLRRPEMQRTFYPRSYYAERASLFG